MIRRFLTVAALIALAGSAVLGGNVFGWRDELFGLARANEVAVTRNASTAGERRPATGATAGTRSQPWWQEVAVLRGPAPGGRRSFTVDRDALQWRITPTCTSGRVVVRRVGGSAPLSDSPCPAAKAAFGTTRGREDLVVEAGSAWELRVEQQVDVPLVEPPTPAMMDPASTVLSRSPIYRIDQRATGTVTIRRLAGGGHSLRFERFFVTPNSDLEVRFSTEVAPRTTEDFLRGSSALVAVLDVTAGSLNFDIPPEVDPMEYRSVVLWCERLKSAYSAAEIQVDR